MNIRSQNREEARHGPNRKRRQSAHVLDLPRPSWFFLVPPKRPCTIRFHQPSTIHYATNGDSHAPARRHQVEPLRAHTSRANKLRSDATESFSINLMPGAYHEVSPETCSGFSCLDRLQTKLGQARVRLPHGLRGIHRRIGKKHRRCLQPSNRNFTKTRCAHLAQIAKKVLPIQIGARPLQPWR